MPVIWLTIFFAAGVLAGDTCLRNPAAWAGVGSAICLALAAGVYFSGKRIPWIPSRLWIWAAVLSGGFVLGGLRLQLALPDQAHQHFIVSYIQGRGKVVLTGLVVDEPDCREQVILLRIRPEQIILPNSPDPNPVFGDLQVVIPAESEIRYGDRVRLEGHLFEPSQEEGFNQREYLNRKSIYAVISRPDLQVLESSQGRAYLGSIYSLKARALNLVYRLWPDPEASLLAGILLGVETGIPEEVETAFRQTGTTHIIAISGFNITIIAGLFSRVFTRLLDRRLAALAAVGGIMIYTVLVGADAAVVRAAVMGGLSIFASQIGRRQHGLNAAALASLVMMAADPQIPWDISFQLSLAATLGLILYADPLTAWFQDLASRLVSDEIAARISGPVSEFVLFTFAAQLTTLPVMAFHFHSFSWSAFLANPAILPVQPPIMILGGLALILGLVWLPLGRVSASLVYPFILFTIRTVEWFARLPLPASRWGEISLIWIWVYYGVLALVTFGGPLLIWLGALVRPASLAGGLAWGVVLVWRMGLAAPDGSLQLDLIDVGTGTAIFLQSPSGQRVLINGGPSTRALSSYLGRRLPPFRRDLDLVIITSPVPQDLDGLADNLPRFPPERLLWVGDLDLCREADYLRQTARDQQLSLEVLEAGQVLELDDGLRLHLLGTGPRGGTLLVEYGGFRALLPFGLTPEQRDAWREGLNIGRVTVLLLADSGYQSSNPRIWIENLSPRLILLSVGIKNGRGLPDRGLMDRLAGYSVLRTDRQGTVSLRTDGQQLWVEVDRLK